MDMPGMPDLPPVNVPIDDPNADTEWNDILRKHGVIPEKPPSPTPAIEEALFEARRLAHDNRLEGKELDELAELEDAEDEAFLEAYKQRRLAELSQISRTSIHGSVYPLQKPDYPREVTEASRNFFVFVHLTSALGTNIESRILTELWRETARKYGELKFCEIRADLCIKGYPEKNCPTILVYHDGDIIKQLVTLKELQGLKTTQNDLQRFLVKVGAVSSTDHRIIRMNREVEERTVNVQSGKANPGEDDDDEWD